jgi:DNA-binding PucR family transcriptional regulator
VRSDPDELLSQIAARLQATVRELSATLTEAILAEEPELSDDQAIADSLASSVFDNVSMILRVFEMRPDPETVRAPPAAVDFARRLAQRGIPISALLRAYRLGQADFQQVVLAQIAAAGLEADTVSATAARLSSVAFDYIDRISEDVVVVYQLERDGWMRNRTAARSARIMALLANANVAVAELEKTLGFRVDQPQLGVVAWSTATTAPLERLTAVERCVAAVAQQIGCQRAPVLVTPDESTVWAWLPLASKGPVEVAVAGDESVRIALGDPAVGVEGFRTTHRQARHAQVVALAASPAYQRQVTSWSAVGPIALMCADRESLASWVHEALGDLASAEDKMTRLRDTLGVFLATGRSYTASAQLLHLHKNTVQYRVRKASDALGQSLDARRLDVELALLACQWLGDSVLRPVDAS